MNDPSEPIKGRGTNVNPDNRFDKMHIRRDEDLDPAQDPSPKTIFFKDTTKAFINYNDSPDVGFNAGINPYRGCEHGCIYCYARPSHEYLGFSSGIDFETKIMVKENAPELLRKELSSKKYNPQVIALSGNTDCYQPIERKLQLTRRCLSVLAEFRNPVGIITKNRLVERDIDLLAQLNQFNAVAVFITITTLDPDLARVMEPRASIPEDRLKTIERLSKAGIAVGVMTAPIIPGLTDEEIPSLLKHASEAGASFCGYTVLRLAYSLKDLFSDWLTKHFPDRKSRILNRIQEIRGGKLNDPNFGSRMSGEGIWAEQIRDLFYLYKRKYGFLEDGPQLTTRHFKRHESQLVLFE